MSSWRIPVLLAVNSTYVQHAAVAIVSLLENNPEHFFDVVVAGRDLGADAEKLRRSVASYGNCRLQVRAFEVPDGVALPLRAHYSTDIYTRLWAAEFFPADTDKILYLDSDLVVTGDIGDLWYTELGENMLAAVTIPGSTRCGVLGIPETYGYFNSGVLLLNLAAWRRENGLKRCLDYIEREAANVVDPDQDTLNACYFDRRVNLPSIFNAISPFFFDYHPLGITETERQVVQRDARIVHFNGASKPWSFMSRHPRRRDYWRYLRLTAWRGFTPQDRSLVNFVKRQLAPMLSPALIASLKSTLRGRAVAAVGNYTKAEPAR